MAVEKIDLVRDTTMQQIAGAVAAIAANTGGYKLESFKDVQTIVRAGLAGQFFHIGDQIVAERETSITATFGNSESETSGITAVAVDADTFIAAIGNVRAGEYEFKFNGVEWHYDDIPVSLANYGIVVTGTPVHGDEVIVHETAQKLIWDIIGIDAETLTDPNAKHSLTLQMHDCYTELQFDSTEAWYYAENGLAAGTYYFTIDPTYDTAHNTYKDTGYQFTLASAVPAKGVLTMSWANNAEASSMSIMSYSAIGSSSPIEAVNVTEGTSGTNLGQLTTAGDPNNNLNSIQRARYGSNNWHTSPLRRLLNSKETAGNWWKSLTKFDRPPAWAVSVTGFLNGLDPEFVAVLGNVEKVTALNTISDGGGKETNTEKIFLLSRSEIFAGDEVVGGEGAPYKYYSDYSGYQTPNSGADSNRIKYRNGAAKYWWLRSPHSGSANYVRSVYPSGAHNSDLAAGSGGVAPACVIV